MAKVKDKYRPKGTRGVEYAKPKMAPAGLVELAWGHTKKRFPDLETDIIRKLHILEECFKFKQRQDYVVRYSHVAMALDLLHYYLRELESLVEYRIQFDGLQIKYLMEAVDFLSKAYRRFGEPNFSWRLASIDEFIKAFETIKPPEVSNDEGIEDGIEEGGEEGELEEIHGGVENEEEPPEGDF